MPTVAAQVLLGVYAVLLAVGGGVGYRQAGSRPSLIAGLASGAVALVALGLSFATDAGFVVGAILAAALVALFAFRFAKGRKFMPAGLLALVSLAVLILLALRIAGPPSSVGAESEVRRSSRVTAGPLSS